MIKVEVKNLDKVLHNLEKVATDLPEYVQAANKQASSMILQTKGMKNYPPATAANAPPPPYYIRGRGTQTASGNLGNSQRLGTRWEIIPYSRVGMKISNPVTYAPYVHGEEQAGKMAEKGWRKLFDVAQEKITEIAGIYNRWINKLIKDKGL